MTMKKEELERIDPALGLMAKFSKINHNTSSHIMKMRQEVIFTNGLLPAKIKALMATIWSVSAHCEPCLKFYALKAKELGATENEIAEILAIASVMGGCVGEMWALKAYQAFKESVSSASCCEVGE